MKCFFEYIRSSLTSDQMFRVRPYVCRAFGVLYAILVLLLAGVLYRIPSCPGRCDCGYTDRAGDILSVYIPEKTDRT